MIVVYLFLKNVLDIHVVFVKKTNKSYNGIFRPYI